MAGTPSTTAHIKCAANCPSGTTEDESGVCVPNCAVDNENVEFSYIPAVNPLTAEAEHIMPVVAKKDIRVKVQVKLSPKARPYNVLSPQTPQTPQTPVLLEQLKMNHAFQTVHIIMKTWNTLTITYKAIYVVVKKDIQIAQQVNLSPRQRPYNVLSPQTPQTPQTPVLLEQLKMNQVFAFQTVHIIMKTWNDNIQGYLCSCKPGTKRIAGTPSETTSIQCVDNCPSGTTEDESGVCVPNCVVDNENVEYTYDNIQGFSCSCKEGYSNSAGTGEFVTETETIKCCLLYLGVCVSNCPPGTTADEAGTDCPPGTQYEAGGVPDCAYNNENVEYTYDNIQGYLCSCKPGTKRIEGTPSETTSIQCVYNCPSGKIEAVTQSETLCISTPDCAAICICCHAVC